MEEWEFGLSFSVLLIGHRQSLLQANAKRLGLQYYLHIPLVWTGTYSTYVPENKLAISIDSLPKYLKPKRHKYKVVLIDESEQVFAHLVSETLKDRRDQCYRLLNHYIAAAKTVIALDADMNRIYPVPIEWPDLHPVIKNDGQEIG